MRMRVGHAWRWMAILGVVWSLRMPVGFAECRSTTEVIGTAGGTLSTLLTTRGRVCSVEFLATANGGFAQVFDSPTSSPTHDQAKNISEPGAATSGNWVASWFGPQGKPTLYGLYVLAKDGRVIVNWDSGQ